MKRVTGTAVNASLLGLAVALAPGAPAAADEIRADQWHLRYLSVAEAHERTKGAGVTVAIVGAGVDATHPDLAANVLTPVAVDGDTDSARFDPDGRGTALAGLVAGHGHGTDQRDGVLGLAPAATVLPVVLRGGARAASGGRAVDAEQVAAGIELAARSGAEVIVVGYHLAGNDRLRKAVADARATDAIVVAADGNRAGDGVGPFPAAYDGVLAAVPLTRDGAVLLPSDSGRRLGFGVPGERIMTTNTGGGYRIDDGAAAAGILAGAVALVRAAYPQLRADAIVDRLTATVADAGARGPDAEHGQGRLDLVAALTRTVPPPGTAASGSPAATASQPVGAPAPRTAPGPLRWLLALPLLAVFGALIGRAVIAERRTEALPREGDATAGTESEAP